MSDLSDQQIEITPEEQIERNDLRVEEEKKASSVYCEAAKRSLAALNAMLMNQIEREEEKKSSSLKKAAAEAEHGG